MVKILKNMGIVCFGLLLIVNLSGCIAMLGAAAGGTGTALWLSGKLSAQVSAPYERTIKATKEALGALKMEVKKETHTDEVTQIKSEYVDGSVTWIDIRPLSETTSKIEIRVGIKGDKTASNKILETIKKYL